jgi:hypothetical protein
LKHYAEAAETARRSWTLNRNWPLGLTYLVAALAQLGRIEEAQAAFADLKALDPGLSCIRAAQKRLYRDQGGLEHLLDGLRQAGFE